MSHVPVCQRHRPNFSDLWYHSQTTVYLPDPPLCTLSPISAMPFSRTSYPPLALPAFRGRLLMPSANGHHLQLTWLQGAMLTRLCRLVHCWLMRSRWAEGMAILSSIILGAGPVWCKMSMKQSSRSLRHRVTDRNRKFIFSGHDSLVPGSLCVCVCVCVSACKCLCVCVCVCVCV